MPIARFEMPDGRVARFEVPEGTTPEQAQAMMQDAMPSAKESGKRYASQEANPLERGGLNALQGLTFGFGDELLAGLASLGSPGNIPEAYKQKRDFLRGMQSQYESDFPIGAPVTQAMTSMALGPALASRTAPGLVPAIGQGARTGAITGGLTGLGESEATDFGQAAMDMIGGTASGAAFGAAAPVAGAVVGGAGRSVSERFSPGAAQRGAQAKVAEALLRDSALPGQALGQANARLTRLGPEARIADVGGQNTRQLLDTLSTLPGRTKQTVESAIHDRVAGRSGRLISAADRGLSVGGQRGAQVVDDLIATRQAASVPLYGQLHQMEVQATPRLASTLNAAESLGAGREAAKIATAQELPYSLSADQWNQSAGRLAMRDLDHLKQGIDKLIAKETDPSGKVSALGFRLQGLRQRLLEQLDDATQGFYKQARDAFAGPSALIDATNAGRRFMTADDAATRQVMSGLSLSEQEAFRVGAFEALRNKLGRPGGQTEVLGMWKDQILREKLKAIFPSERAFRDFATEVAGEARLKSLEGVGRGSQTAARLAGMEDIDLSPLRNAAATAAAAKTGDMPGMLVGATNLFRRVQTPEPVRDRMGALLLSRDPNELRALGPLLQEINRERAQAASGLGLLGGQAGQGLIGGLLSP